MGCPGGTRSFGVSKDSVNITQQLQGARVALEASGHIHHLLRKHFRRNTERAALMANHLHKGSAFPRDLIEGLVSEFVHEMVEMRKRFPSFLVVFEGPSFVGKSVVSAARLARAKKAFGEKHFSKSLTVSDCIVRLAALELTEEGVPWLIPPAEADSQLAYLQMQGRVDFIITTSEDIDFVLYPGVTNVVYHFERRANNDFFGVIKTRDTIFQRREFVMGKKNPKHMSIDLSSFTDLSLLVLASLMSTDYCKIAGVGLASAFEIIPRFKDLEHLDDVWPVSWKNARRKKATRQLMKGLLCFFVQPVYDVTLPLPTDQFLATTYIDHKALPHALFQFLLHDDDPVVTHLRTFVEQVATRAPVTISPAPQTPMQYVHCGEVCTIDATTRVFKHRFLHLPASRSTPLGEAAGMPGAVPRLVFSTCEMYFARASFSDTDPSFSEALVAAAAAPFGEPILQRGAQRLQHDKDIEASIEHFDEHLFLTRVSATIPQSQNRLPYKVRVAFKCSGGQAASPRVVDSIEEALCECTIRSTSRCSHVAALLNLTVLVSAQAGKDEVCTSLPCLWDGAMAVPVPGCDRGILTAEHCRDVKFKAADLQKAGFVDELKQKQALMFVPQEKGHVEADERFKKLDFSFFNDKFLSAVHNLDDVDRKSVV